MRTREEHLTWAKERALAHLEKGDVASAISSMLSDLDKHPETTGHSGIQRGGALMLAGFLSRPDEARRFIEGFN